MKPDCAVALIANVNNGKSVYIVGVLESLLIVRIRVALSSYVHGIGEAQDPHLVDPPRTSKLGYSPAQCKIIRA